jgi:preprotein translocase subunit SecD
LKKLKIKKKQLKTTQLIDSKLFSCYDTPIMKQRIIAISILIIGLAIGYFVYASEPKLRENGVLPTMSSSTTGFLSSHPFRLGLDLAGGTRLVYKADVSGVQGSTPDAMNALRDVIERRVNLFGVGEPLVQTEKSNLTGEERLSVELPGITDIDTAVQMIGQTPTLEFKTTRGDESKKQIIAARTAFIEAQKSGEKVELTPLLLEDPEYVPTGLTGGYLKKSQVVFNEQNQPEVSLQFNEEGTRLFADITKENVGKQVAIYLDGSAISAPTVNSVITGGTAVIQGNFTVAEAKTLVGRLNSGALPVPITLIGTEQVGPTLGAAAVEAGVKAAVAGLLLVSLFLIIWYRLPGLVAVVALALYVFVMLALFKLIPVTLTAAGIAGFIISIGLAVDANVLIFERMKEERRKNNSLADITATGFSRAWTSIRDSNISSLITALILFLFGASVVKGFALTFGLGVLTSMLSAIIVTRILLLALVQKSHSKTMKFLFGNGFTK